MPDVLHIVARAAAFGVAVLFVVAGSANLARILIAERFTHRYDSKEASVITLKSALAIGVAVAIFVVACSW